ncbi:MAG TPA: DUF72 domain-containing protein [Candidatus Acidoferrum sp.]|nr:DUF72 domain-containing protein [Candidatus Acidoferrum sp.]
MQDSLFPDEPATVASPAPKIATVRKSGGKVELATPDPGLLALASALPATLRLGTSSWSYPGWAGLVWDHDCSESTLARHGLAAYAKFPLFRAVSIDRSFYKPLEAVKFAQYAAQVNDDFRFTVKAPGLVTDAMLRDEEGHGMRRNPYFLDATLATRDFVEPALQGLGLRTGALVFQLSPLPPYWFERMPELIERLHEFLKSLPVLSNTAPDAVYAVEVRDKEWLTPQFTQALKDTGTTYCLGLHAKMPRIAGQLPLLRALWPCPLVCRWNLNPLHGAFGYEDAAKQYEPYDKLQDPDPETRNELARVIAGVTSAGQNAFVTVSNKSEGCAPLSVIELAKAVVALKG